jgi:hypothetical protein
MDSGGEGKARKFERYEKGKEGRYERGGCGWEVETQKFIDVKFANGWLAAAPILVRLVR